MRGLGPEPGILMSQPPSSSRRSQSAFVHVADRFGLVPIPLLKPFSEGEMLDANWLGNKVFRLAD